MNLVSSSVKFQYNKKGNGKVENPFDIFAGYSYDEVKCKDVEQETCYNAPELVEEIQPVTNTVAEAQEVRT